MAISIIAIKNTHKLAVCIDKIDIHNHLLILTSYKYYVYNKFKAEDIYIILFI
jgi:hypothetical protein